jgi:hypothetical protein
LRIEEPGIAEAERLAGAGIAARGGVTKSGALSPDVIAQHKSAIQGMANQWQLGMVNWQKLKRETNKLGWEILSNPEFLRDPVGFTAKMEPTGILEELHNKVLEAREKRALQVRSPDGRVHEIQLGNAEEQSDETNR